MRLRWLEHHAREQYSERMFKRNPEDRRDRGYMEDDHRKLPYEGQLIWK